MLSTLRGPVVSRMTFGVGFLFISSTSYEDIAKAIEAGKIVVKAKSGISHFITATCTPL